jgi:fatty-acyl-CoA synthase
MRNSAVRLPRDGRFAKHPGVKAVPPESVLRAAKPGSGWLRALELTAGIAKSPACTLPAVIEERAASAGDAPALLSDHECLSYRLLAVRARRYARWALRNGLAKGDVVCLLMPNRPEYMAIWLGITRVGGVVALLNTHLAGASLAHCIDIVAPSHIIVAHALTPAFEQARSQLRTAAKVWSHGDGGGPFPEITHDLDRAGDDSAFDDRLATIDDLALYIYTSGTTGWPKAARVSHRRLMTWSCWFSGMMDAQPSDRMYNCLPMYHSVGGVVATGAMLVSGGSAAIRDKFSAGSFWDDIARFDCTLFQYIGELCRYLVQAPVHPRERDHPLRLCCGNGLRADVWDAFKHRFQIPQILEFYAATEGNVTLFNYEGKAGAIGRIPPFLAHRSPVTLVQFDMESGAPVRDARGFCIRCGVNEVGEAIGKIPSNSSSNGSRFEGYTSQAESEKKVLRDVFGPGDAWFRTGDLMRKDASGYFYFVDRIGDTFRWKGENVATSEVAAAIAAFPAVSHATVYGVQVPGQDGRAGMAALTSNGALDLAALRAHLVQRLPGYARPVFLRVMSEIAVTSTFKHRNAELARQGFDPTGVSDPLYVHDPERQAYVPLDAARYQRIIGGSLRL